MQNGKTNSKGGYIIILAVMIVGFLIVFVASTLTLVLHEMQDGRGRQNYLKALYAAQAGQELALFQIKNLGFGYDNMGNFPFSHALEEPDLQVDFTSAVSNHTGVLLSSETQIFPLFWIDNSGDVSSISGNFTFTDISGQLVWNIIGKDSGISGTGSFSNSDTVSIKQLQNVGGSYVFQQEDQSIGNFLQNNSGSYLIVFNPELGNKTFSLHSSPNIYFTLPKANIISSAKIGKYKQNLQTFVDNTEFLGILRYSIFSQ